MHLKSIEGKHRFKKNLIDKTRSSREARGYRSAAAGFECNNGYRWCRRRRPLCPHAFRQPVINHWSVSRWRGVPLTKWMLLSIWITTLGRREPSPTRNSKPFKLLCKLYRPRFTFSSRLPPVLSSGRGDQTDPTRLPRVVLEDVRGGLRATAAEERYRH